MAGKEEFRIFVGGLPWDISERQLQNAFGRYGKILDCQIVAERDTGRSRGFGFLAFADRVSMDDAIRDMHGRELGDRIISVNKAQPKMGEDIDDGYRGGYSSSGRGGYRSGDRSITQDECFKCGRFGHWARDCPTASSGRSGGGGMFSRSRIAGANDRGDRFRVHDPYIDDRYDGGRYGYGDRDRFDIREDRNGGHDRYMNDRYQPSRDQMESRYGGPDRYPSDDYGRDRDYDRGIIPRGSNAYGGGGPARSDGRSYRTRAVPYDSSGRGGRY